MKLYSSSNAYKLYNGNMLDILEVIEPNSIDSIITDPPYELNFMSKGWDNSGIAFQKETWEQCYKVLKSGGYLLAFGGSRTFHRIAVAIEDAGFEIRDTIMWLYGSGFPKSLNIGLAIDKKNGVESKIIGEKIVPDITGDAFGTMNEKQGGSYKNVVVNIKEAQNEWKGWGTALKPSYEPIIVARKPVENTVVDNVMKYGVGGINIDECRVETTEINRKGGATTNGNLGWKPSAKTYNDGRFPANTILTYDETDYKEVCGGFPNTSSKESMPNKEYSNTDSIVNFVGTPFKSGYHYEDSGSASRYFYCAKASKKDRDDGLDEFKDTKGGSYQFRQDGSLDGEIPIRKNIHPTVKPMELMQYLIRLVTPKGGTILDPFNGSGSTGKAVMYENAEKDKDYKYIGIELTDEYLPISKARIEYVYNKQIQTKLF